ESMMTNFELLFWLAAGVIAYTYVGYPLLMWLWSRLRKPHRKLAIEPRVSVVLTAREAGSDLHAGIENLLDLDYPQNRREIVVAGGGTEAEATALARTFARRGVRVERWPAGQGRAALLNDLVPRLHGDVVVLVDAGHRIEPDAVHAMVRHFADPRTGAVSGHLVHDGGRTGVGEVYENFLRDC